MNYQNYSKMERGVYTPSLDKLLDICERLHITPNELLLEGRTYEDYKKEVFESVDNNILDITDVIKRVEELRVKALLAKKAGDEEQERWYLDFIIGMYAWTNEHYWEIADYLYKKRLYLLIDQASEETNYQLQKVIKTQDDGNF
jgi:transcriptional regulator with XRE-family HTH domain